MRPLLPQNYRIDIRIQCWYPEAMKTIEKMRKITLVLPDDLIRRAQEATQKNLTATVKEGLRILSASQAYDALLKLRGKLKLDIDLDELRKDRDE